VFGADGSLPLPSTPTFIDFQYYPAGNPKAKILYIANKKYYSYMSEGNVGAVVTNKSRDIVCWNISDPPLATPVGTANVADYHLPSGFKNIFGFDCMQTDGIAYIYASHVEYLSDGVNIDAANSGLLFFQSTATGTTTITFSRIPSTSDFEYTDLELDKAGNLFMVSGIPTAANAGLPVGSLAYLPYSSLGLTAVTPTVVSSGCAGTPNFSVASRGRALNNFSSNFDNNPFYLGKQYPQEVVAGLPTITGVDINTRCAPGYGASGVPNPQYSVTIDDPAGCGSYSYVWAPLDLVATTAGTTISLDPILDDYTSSNPKIIGLHSAGFGGAPFLTANYLLTVTDCSGCVTSMIVRNKLITSGVDLASKDSPFDLYDEANDQTVNPANWNIWNSPDLFNRYHNDGNTYPFSDEVADFALTGPTDNFLFVNIRNVGCANYDPGTAAIPAVLHTYWTMGGFSGETWPNAWNGVGETSPLCDASHPKLGSELDFSPVPVPAIAAGSNTYVMTSILGTEWTPPNPQTYAPCTAPPPTMELCFLARIVDGHNPSCVDGMSICENTTGTVGMNVNNNNNIVTLNTSIAQVNSLPAVKPHMIVGGNGGSSAAPFSIQFVNDHILHPGTGPSTLSNYVSIKVLLGDLYNLWVSGGSKGTYTATDANEKSVTFDGSNTVRLDNITMPANSVYPINLEFRLRPDADGKQMPRETVHFRQLVPNASIYTLIDSVNVTYVDSATDTVTHIVTRDTVNTVLYDTTYYSDSVYANFSFQVQYEKPSKGVLTVTEISNGATPGCDYAEMIVSNCGDNKTMGVDVQGWIIDDNTGDFNLNGCAVDAGITRSHYRLAKSSVWSDVPVGSVIVVYNAANNCYNLPDTFTVDTTLKGNIYWLPVGSSAATLIGKPCLERFKTVLDSSICIYVSDTATDSTSDSSYYQVADNWQSTIAFNAYGDAFQVRCPRCGDDVSLMPEFYHGVGYGPVTGDDAFVGIAPDANSVGGAVISNTGSAFRYSFIGISISDLSDPSKWSTSSASSPGFVPPTLGSVNEDYTAAIKNMSLNFPCCSKNKSEARHGNPGNKNDKEHVVIGNLTRVSSKVEVFPNPAITAISFNCPLSGKTTISIFDISGKLVEQRILLNSISATFDVKAYAPGVYLYKIITDADVTSGKFIVE